MKRTGKTLLMMAALVLGLLVFADTSKAAVAGLKQNMEKTTDTSITLEWQNVLGASYYDVQFSNDGLSGWVSMTKPNGTSATVNNLSKGSSYYAKVIAKAGGYSYNDSGAPIDESAPILVSTKPSVPEVQGLVQTSATTDSVSISWAAVPGASGYEVYRYNGYNNYGIVGTTQATSFTISGLGPSQQIQYFVIANMTTAAGLTGQSGTYKTTTVKTVPDRVAKCTMTSWLGSIDVAYYGWTGVNNADGYQFQILDRTGKKLFNCEGTGTSYRLSPVFHNKFTQCRARAYVMVGTQKIYGAWSDSQWNAAAKKLSIKRIAKNKKIKVSWSKISGISQYDVYVSTKQKGGFKKFKSLGPKKKSCVITKCGKKKIKPKKSYYIRIKYVIKVGGKKVASKISAEGSSVVYR